MLCFFKQKTAYEMRMSDWSSDVCSSDLAALLAGTQALSPGEAQPKQFGIVMGEADIGDAGGKKARAAAACFYPCLRLLRAEAAKALVCQRVDQGFLAREIAIEGRRDDPAIAPECPQAKRDAVQ